MTVQAAYFDGKTSRRHQVALTVEHGIATISGEASRRCPLAQLHVSEATRHGARIITFPDGAYLEVDDQAAFAQLLAETGHRETLVARLQQSWRATLLAAVAMAGALFLLWRLALPAAADMIAAMVPASVERTLGESTLQVLDRRLFAPSRLAPDRQERISAQFAVLAQAGRNTPDHALLFRNSRVGPNALALPAGRIIVTDELATLLADDDKALMAVLAHELGHLHKRHLMRRLVHGAAVSAAGLALFGDASGLVATLPALMLDLKYSRDAELEADDYAAALMKANGLSASHLATALERLADDDERDFAYLSSHPATAERIARLRAMR